MTEPQRANTDAPAQSEVQLAKTAELNDSQKLHLRVSCQYMDRLLQDVEAILHATESKSPFPHYRLDLTPAQGRVVEDYIRRFRSQLQKTLEWQQIVPPSPEVPATRAISTRLHFIDNAVADIRPKEMRGSGSLSEEAATELSGVVHELSSLVENMMNYVNRELDSSLEDRILKLPKGEDHRVLTQLEEVITRRGLVEFRSRLDSLLSRLEDRTYEVALFGRVSSGKSSFLNALLDTEVLPVGVNPITAVPTRIRYGPEIAAYLRYGNGEPIKVSLEEFRTLISESGNPGNQRTVTRALLEYPSAWLSEGIILVDTPGLGSLAQRGAAETMAYLPSCDLALLLIDAASTLTAEDIGTLRLLLEARIPALVVLSKSDLLQRDDVHATGQYIQQQIERELRMSLPVHPVSSTAAGRSLLQQFFEEELQPRFAKSQALKRESVDSKLMRLRQDVISSLQTTILRINHAKPGFPGDTDAIENSLRAITGNIGELASELDRQILQLRNSSKELLERLADELASEATIQKSTRVASSEISRRLQTAIEREIDRLLQMAQEAAARAVGNTRRTGMQLGRSDLPTEGSLDHFIREVPRFETEVPTTDIRVGVWKLLGGGALRFHIRKALQEELESSLRSELEPYTSALSQWASRLAKTLQFEINSYVDIYRAAVQKSNALEGFPVDSAALEDDIRELAAPPAAAPIEHEAQKGA